jgi:putative ABC transport system permease protein
MAFWEAIKLGLENIVLHKLRALLTMLGMVFGVAAVISMLSIGGGAKEETLAQINALGIDNIWLKSVKPTEVKEQEEKTDSATQGQQPTSAGTSEWGLTVKDLKHLKIVLPNLEKTILLKELSEDVWTSRKKAQLTVIGTEPDYQFILGLGLVAGRFISRIDFEEGKKICVLGAEAKKALFGPYRQPLGESLRIGNDYFNVVGILEEKPVSKGMRDINRAVYVPFSPDLKKTRTSWSMEEQRAVVESEAEVDEICLKVSDTAFIDETDRIIRNSLKKSHPRGDYEVMVPQELLEQSRKNQWIFNIVMGSIAGISLLVGGIGIMNIMLATVTERTKEIGIRRALGARRRDIIKQFLLETLVLSFIGGIIGIGLGIGGAKGIPLLAGGDYKTIISVYPVFAAFSISLLIGVIFGVYPAYKAAHISPMEALRCE